MTATVDRDEVIARIARVDRPTPVMPRDTFHALSDRQREILDAVGQLFADALCRRDPLADNVSREKELNRPMRSPLIVAVCAEVVENNPKVPVVEQIVTVGAAAQNMMNAAHAMGYAAIMLTGKNAHDPHVKQALGLQPKDEIVGFLYFGTPEGDIRPKRRPAAAAFVREWTGE